MGKSKPNSATIANSEGVGYGNMKKSLKKNIIKRKKKKTNCDNNQSYLLCIEYLNNWKNHRSTWKFEKVKQIRLLSNVFEKEKLPEESFRTFLEYMVGASEAMKKLLITKANEVFSELERWDSLSEEDKLIIPKVDEYKYERARSLVQYLE